MNIARGRRPSRQRRALAACETIRTLERHARRKMTAQRRVSKWLFQKIGISVDEDAALDEGTGGGRDEHRSCASRVGDVRRYAGVEARLSTRDEVVGAGHFHRLVVRRNVGVIVRLSARRNGEHHVPGAE